MNRWVLLWVLFGFTLVLASLTFHATNKIIGVENWDSTIALLGGLLSWINATWVWKDKQ